MTEFIERLSSRKFLLALAGILIQALMVYTGQVEPSAAADATWKLILGYIGAEGLADIVTRIKE